MQEVFDKIIEKIKADPYTKLYGSRNSGNYMIPVDKAIEIVKQAAAEYNNGWFSCSERLPDEYGDYLVAWKPLHMSAEDIIRKVGRAIPHYYEIVEYDPDDEELWIGSIEQAQGEYEIIAWKPLPAPYQPKGE